MTSFLLRRIAEKYNLTNGQKLNTKAIRNIAKLECMQKKEVLQLLHVSSIATYKCLHNRDCNFYIYLYCREELEEIKEKVLRECQNLKHMNGNMIKLMMERYRLSDRDMREILGISYILYNRAKNENKAVTVFCQIPKDTNFIEIFEKWKKKDTVTRQDVKEIQDAYRLSKKEIKEKFHISQKEFKELLEGQIETVKIDLYSEKEKYELKKKTNYQNKYRTSKRDIERFAEKEEVSFQKAGQILDINEKRLQKLAEEKQLTLKITGKNTKWKAERMLLDLKYNPIYGEHYYTLEELTLICNGYYLTIEDFFYYKTRSKVMYEMFLEAVQNNPKGVWIGSKTRISNEFIEENYTEIEKAIEKMAQNLCIQLKCDYKDDFKSEAFVYLLETAGIFEKNLDYNPNLLIHTMLRGIKGVMLTYYQKIGKEWSLERKGKNGYYENAELLQDNRYNPEVCIIDKIAI